MNYDVTQAMQQILDLLRREIGLDASTLGVNAVIQVIAASAEKEKLDTERYAEGLIADPSMLRRLVERIIVPETHFFRHPGSFIALRKWLATRSLQMIGSPVAGTRMLRVLSAPCSTGEEVYSIAIELRESGLPYSDFLVYGLDISTANIAFARRGIYSGKAFREGRAVALRQSYFHLRPDPHDPASPTSDTWQIDGVVASRVEFLQTNLVSATFRDTLPQFDIIFCRNLLIYLDDAARRRLLGDLRQLLNPGGLLFVGSAEVGEACESGFSRAPYEMAFACIKSEKSVKIEKLASPPHAISPPPLQFVSAYAPPVPVASTSLPVMPRPKTEFRLATAPAIASPASASVGTATISPAVAPVSRAAASPSPQPVHEGVEQACQEAWALANAGRLDQARNAVNLVLARASDNPEAHALLGLLQERAGDKAAAEASYRRALFLDPYQSSALLNLALLLEASGRAEAAKPLRARARRQRPG
ncbi:MAG: CheR family methyltransferase [Candidatus Methylacidiphilales bacterium]|nr:CheR family methyltransferase [Candidatus Methylacidiphilales bacterium]